MKRCTYFWLFAVIELDNGCDNFFQRFSNSLFNSVNAKHEIFHSETLAVLV
jgi:hypothetical protein